MPTQPPDAGEAFHTRFHRRWSHLNDPHVRTLAWLIDAPDLLDPQAPQWQGKIVSLGGKAGDDARQWLTELDRHPAALQAFLDLHPSNRLGRYAENLMAFYFHHLSILSAHGVQVRADRNSTIGEFDFLLKQGGNLLHWEFATKLYLLESGGQGLEADCFVGPNLADTLGAKMRKILDRQLSLAAHPAAQIHLPQPVSKAQALIKGWLFYRDDDPADAGSIGVTRDHCRGFWRTAAELDVSSARRYAILPRLAWLPPLKAAADRMMNGARLKEALATHFAQDEMPVLVAQMEMRGDTAFEAERSFIVPDGWRARAEYRVREAAGAMPT